MAKEIEVRKIVVDTSEAVESMEALEESTDAVDQSFEGLDSQLEAMPGPLGKATKGVKQLSKSFKALLANPIVLLIAAIVAALAALFKAFTKTEEGADKMKDVMAGVSAVIDVLTERAAKLFKALGQIVRGNFKEGFQEMGEAVKGVGDELRYATAAAVEYERAVRAVFNAETELITADAERRRQISELRFLSRDLTKSYQERIQALEQAAAIEVEGLNEAIELQQAKVDLINQEILINRETPRTREQARQLAEAEVALLDLQTQSLERQKGLLDEVNAIRNEERAATNAAIAEEEARAAESEKKRMDDEKAAAELRREEADLDRMFAEEEAAWLLELDKDTNEQLKQSSDALTDQIIANSERELEAVIMAEQQKLMIRQGTVNATNAILGDGFAALGGFLAEGSKLQKKIQIADATRAAIMGAIQAYQSAAAIPVVGAVLGPIAAAAALAAGMANVRKIATTPDPLGGGASVPTVTLAQPARNIDSRSLTNADQSIPAEVEIIQDSSQRGPIKSYVVQSDVTAAQDIEKQRNEDATL